MQGTDAPSEFIYSTSHTMQNSSAQIYCTRYTHMMQSSTKAAALLRKNFTVASV